jgi:hypothetical protein
VVAAKAHRERPERQATIEPEAAKTEPERFCGLFEHDDTGIRVSAADQLDHLPRSPRTVPDYSGYPDQTSRRRARRVVQTVLAVLSRLVVPLPLLLMLRSLLMLRASRHGGPRCERGDRTHGGACQREATLDLDAHGSPTTVDGPTSA